MSWSNFIKSESEKDYYKSIVDFIQKDSLSHKICPEHKDIFNAFKYCPINKIKVVIIGQDPYHGESQAHGLAFSVAPECDIPPSLRNIFKEINNDLQTTHKFTNGYLVDWARQGVLLLNSCLTVRLHSPASHKNIGWETFTDNAIELVSNVERPLVFMLWGSFAKGKKHLIDKRHLVLEAAHPSPMSAHNGFFGCKHFSKTNEFLIKQNIDPINWLL